MQENQKAEGKGRVRIGLRIVADANLEPADTPAEPSLIERNKSPDILSDDSRTIQVIGAPPRSVPRLVFANGSSIESRGNGSFPHSEKFPTDQHWSQYCEWRATKCPPSNERHPLDELNQATLEYLGELGELACLVGEHGGAVMIYPELTAKVVDEAGDAFFTGTWALDAWGINFLTKMGGDEPGVAILSTDDLKTERTLFDSYKDVLVSHDEDPEWKPDENFIRSLKLFEHYSGIAMLGALAHGSMTANALKKLVYHKRDQNVHQQCELILVALTCVERVLVMCGKTIQDALQANIAKLDARFPEGYPQGGDDKTGKGRLSDQ